MKLFENWKTQNYFFFFLFSSVFIFRTIVFLPYILNSWVFGNVFGNLIIIIIIYKLTDVAVGRRLEKQKKKK